MAITATVRRLYDRARRETWGHYVTGMQPVSVTGASHGQRFGAWRGAGHYPRGAAMEALAEAKTRAQFAARETDCRCEDRRGRECACERAERGDVRMRTLWDCGSSLEDIEGDCYSESANPDCKPHILKRQRDQFAADIERHGIVFMVSEYFDGQRWQTADSIGGMVGNDTAHVEPELMRAALDAAGEHEASFEAGLCFA